MSWEAFIAPAANLIGGFMDRAESRRAQSKQDDWNWRSLQFARDQFERNIQTRVKDARAAGIHPLFALGAAGAGGSFSAGVMPASGSALGEGIARAGEAISHARTKNPLQAMQSRLLAAQTKQAEAAASRDLAEAQALASTTKRREQAALTRPLVPGAGPTRIRLGETPPKPTHGVRAMEKYVREDGSTGWKYTEDMQMDEAGQILVGAQDAKHYATTAAEDAWNRMVARAAWREVQRQREMWTNPKYKLWRKLQRMKGRMAEEFSP